MKCFLNTLAFLLTAVLWGSAQDSYAISCAHPWGEHEKSEYSPDYVTFQHSGYAGRMAIGVGYEFFDYQVGWETLFGHTPAGPLAYSSQSISTKGIWKFPSFGHPYYLIVTPYMGAGMLIPFGPQFYNDAYEHRKISETAPNGGSIAGLMGIEIRAFRLFRISVEAVHPAFGLPKTRIPGDPEWKNRSYGFGLKIDI